MGVDLRLASQRIENLATEKVRVNIWNDEDEVRGWQESAREILAVERPRETSIYNLSQWLKDYYTRLNPLSNYRMVYSDLLGWALACVDWREIAEGFIKNEELELE